MLTIIFSKGIGTLLITRPASLSTDAAVFVYRRWQIGVKTLTEREHHL